MNAIKLISWSKKGLLGGLKVHWIVLCLIAGTLVSCQPTYVVTLTGTLADFARGDTVFVTLTEGWENVTSPPDSFSIDKKGKFMLMIRSGRRSPPITFVKNNSLYCRLKLFDIDQFSPVILNEMNGNISKITVDSDSTAHAELKL
jgi:hypothetical protein